MIQKQNYCFNVSKYTHRCNDKFTLWQERLKIPWFYDSLFTFPRATLEVAMSRTKLSPSLPGAAIQMGLVPNTCWKIGLCDIGDFTWRFLKVFFSSWFTWVCTWLIRIFISFFYSKWNKEVQQINFLSNKCYIL